jgi:hypothetical protein
MDLRLFSTINVRRFYRKDKGNTLENKIYKSLYDELSDTDIQQEIKKEFPKPEIHRRNGYVLIYYCNRISLAEANQ